MVWLGRFRKGGLDSRRRPILRRRLVAAVLLWLGGNALFLILTSGSVLTWFAFRYRAEDPLAASDAIVLLLGGPVDRPARVAELYRRGLAPVVLMGRTKSVPFDECKVHRRALIREGVPPTAIRILPGDPVENTHDEALRVRDYVRSHRIRRITVVTTAYHTARARWMFRKALRDTGIDVRVAASRDPRFSEADWYTSDIGVRIYRLEAIKNIYYRVVY